MPLNFAQVGSQRNVQEVGEGGAYVHDKYENPLLSVGKMSMSLATAKAKAKAAEDKAAKAEKTDLLNFDPSGVHLQEAFNDHTSKIANTFAKMGGTPESNQETGRATNVAKNLAFSAKGISENIKASDDEARKLVAAGKLDYNDYKSAVKDLVDKANALYKSNPTESGLQQAVSLLGSVDPNDFINSGIKKNNDEIKSIANGITEKTDAWVGQQLKSLGGGYQSMDTKKIKKVADEQLLFTVNSNYTDPQIQRTYLDILKTDPNNLIAKKYSSTIPGEGKIEFGVNNKGEKIYVDKNKYVWDSFRSDLISKSDYLDENGKKILQDYKTGSSGGLGWNSKAKGGVTPISGLELNAGVSTVDPNGVTGHKSHHGSVFGGYSLDNSSNTPIVVTFGNTNATEHNDKAEGSSIHYATGKMGNATNITFQPILKSRKNGLKQVSFAMNPETGSSINNMTPEQLADHILKVGKENVPYLTIDGVLTGTVEHKKKVVNTGTDGKLSNGVKVEERQTSIPLENHHIPQIARTLNLSMEGKDGFNIQNLKRDDPAYALWKEGLALAQKRFAAGEGQKRPEPKENVGSITPVNPIKKNEPSIIDKTINKVKETYNNLTPSSAAKNSFNDVFKGEHKSYIELAKTHNGSIDELLTKIADWEQERSSDGKRGYQGGGYNWGTNNGNIKSKQEAVAFYKTKYVPKIANLPKDLQALGLQQAINTGDAWGPAMTAAGIYDEKGNGGVGVRATNRKTGKVYGISLGQKKLYDANIDKINEAYNKDPKGFKERYIKAMEYHYNNAQPSDVEGTREMIGRKTIGNGTPAPPAKKKINGFQ